MEHVYKKEFNYIYRLFLLILISFIFIFSLTSCKKNEYKVRFYNDNQELIKEFIIKEDEEITPLILEDKVGYTFTGWDHDLTNITEDINVYPIYEIKKFKVKFLNDDNSIFKEVIVNYNDSILINEVPLKEGYVFTCWDQDLNKVTSDLIVKPIFTKKEVTLTFIDDDLSIIEIIKYDGNEITLPTVTAKEGYIFTGWDQDYRNAKSDLTIKATYGLIPDLYARSYIVVDTYTTLEVNNYDNISLFNISIENIDIVEINDYFDIIGKKIGKTKITVSLKTNPLVTNSLEIEVISKAPLIYTTRTNLDIGGIAYCNISNFNELVETSLNDFTWSVSDDSILKIDDNLMITGLKLGKAKIQIVSKLNPLIKATFQVKVVDPNVDLVINCDNHLDGEFAIGDIISFNLLGGKSLDDYMIISTNVEVARIREDKTLITVSEGYATLACYEINDVTNKTNFIVHVEGKGNIDYVSRLLDLAISQDGYVEGYNNDTKYGEWYPLNNNAWCAMFVSWCWHFAGLSNDLLVKYCSCSEGRLWSEQHGIFHYKADYTPVSGDIVFFLSSGMSHTGIVIYAEGDYLYTVEGNSSNKVGIWRWSLKDARITGYASPSYPIYEGLEPDYSWIKNQKSDSSYWYTVVTEKQDVF